MRAYGDADGRCENADGKKKNGKVVEARGLSDLWNQYQNNSNNNNNNNNNMRI